MEFNKKLYAFKYHPSLIVLYYLLYRLILDIVYVCWVVPVFGYDPYSGFGLDVDPLKVILSYIITFIVAIIIPKDMNRISSMILQLHFVVIIIPVTLIYALVNLSTSFMVMVTFCFCLQVMLIKYLPSIRIFKLRHARLIFISACAVITIVTYLYSIRNQGVQLFSLDFSQIYEIRSETSVNVVLGYLITWQYRMINPLLILLSYINKRYALTIAFALLQIFTFFIFPHKEIIFSLVIIFFVLIVERIRIDFNLSLISFLSIGTLLAALIYQLLNIIFPIQTIVRLLYIPAVIKFKHYSFFIENEKLFYSEGMIGKLLGINYPYSVESGYLVNNPNSNDNTGYLAYAYDNAGFLGMLFISLLFVYLLVLIDSLTIRENKLLIFSVLIYPMIILNDGDLLTLLLTGGLFIFLFFIFVYKDVSTPVLRRRKMS